MGIFNRADARGVAAQLVEDLTAGRKGAADRAINTIVRAGVPRAEARRAVMEGMQDAIQDIDRQRNGRS